MERLGQCALEILDGALKKTNGACFGQIVEREGGVFPCEFGSTVFTQIDLHKGINRSVQLFQNLVRGDMTSIDTGLPMIELDLIPELKEKMDMVRGHEEVGARQYLLHARGIKGTGGSRERERGRGA